MSTRTDFYAGEGVRAQWIGSLQFACHPDNFLKDSHGREALTAIAPSHYQVAVQELMIWAVGGLGAAHEPHHGWLWAWDSSHGNDWIVTFLGGPGGGVHLTAGGGAHWHRLDPTTRARRCAAAHPTSRRGFAIPARRRPRFRLPPCTAHPAHRPPTTRACYGESRESRTLGTVPTFT